MPGELWRWQGADCQASPTRECQALLQAFQFQGKGVLLCWCTCVAGQLHGCQRLWARFASCCISFTAGGISCDSDEPCCQPDCR